MNQACGTACGIYFHTLCPHLVPQAGVRRPHPSNDLHDGLQAWGRRRMWLWDRPRGRGAAVQHRSRQPPPPPYACGPPVAGAWSSCAGPPPRQPLQMCAATAPACSGHDARDAHICCGAALLSRGAWGGTRRSNGGPALAKGEVRRRRVWCQCFCAWMWVYERSHGVLVVQAPLPDHAPACFRVGASLLRSERSAGILRTAARAHRRPILRSAAALS